MTVAGIVTGSQEFYESRRGTGVRRAMYAVIQTGGKQYRVVEGQRVRVEKLDAEVGSCLLYTSRRG